MIAVGGELYIIGERDPKSGRDTPFVKIGIVRENDRRSTDARIKEHQTGNPRLLHIHKVLRTPAVERVETTIHGRFAPHRISGEWFHVDEDRLGEVISEATSLAKRVKRKAELILEAEALKAKLSTSAAIEKTRTTESLHRKYWEAAVIEKRCDELAESARTLLLMARESGHEVDCFISVTERNGLVWFDEEGFRSAHPRVWARYVVETERIKQRFLVSKWRQFELDPEALRPDLAEISEEIRKIVSIKSPKFASYARLHARYLDVLSVQAPVELERELIEVELKASCGSAAGINDVCTWKRELVVSEKFDVGQFRNDHPEKYDRHLVTKPSTTVLRLARDRAYRL